MPVTVLLRDLAGRLSDATMKAQPRHLWDHIAARLHDDKLDAAAGLLEQALEDGQAVVFLDGLDEVPSDKQRKLMRDAVAAFAERYPRSRFVVTCRTLSYRDPAWQLTGWPAFTLARFDGAG